MSCDCNTSFGKVQHFGLSNTIKKLEKNIKDYLEWAFLNIGAWGDIPPSGTPLSSLRPVDYIPGYSGGQAWETRRKEWVHEDVTYTDLSGVSHNPVDIEIYVDGTLQPSGYTIDYTNGRVIFDGAISTSSVVTAQYPFKNVQVYIGDEHNWWQVLQQRSWDVDDDFFTRDQCGDWVVNSHHRIQTPCIVVSAFSRGGVNGYGLGEKCVKRTQGVNLHVFADDKCTRDNIVDILLSQAERCNCLYDIDAVMFSGENKLDCNGALVGTKDYPDLIQYFPWTTARPENVRLDALGMLRCGLYEGVVSADYIIIC